MLDRNKPVQTRDGRKAGVYRWDAPGPYPIHGWIEDTSGEYLAKSWTSDGSRLLACGSSGDLINAPEVTEVWCALYDIGTGLMVTTKAEAIDRSCGTALAFLRLTYTDGVPTAVELIK